MTRTALAALAAAAGLTLAVAEDARATGDLATKATKLPELKLGAPDNDFAVSQTSYELETGKAYRLPITSNGAKEMAFVAPELFGSIWINQIVINHLEVHTPVVRHLEFDDAGTMELYFVPIRTGTFSWEIKGLAERGMKGTFVVK